MIAAISLMGLTAAHTAASSADANAAVAGISKKLNKLEDPKTGITILIACFLFLELFICFGICCWTKYSVNQIAKK